MERDEQRTEGNSLKDRIADMIVERLNTHEKLPPEKDLMRQFGVSKTALREALSPFEANGIIDAQQGSGRYVKTPDVSVQISETWSIVLRADPSFLLKLLEIRAILEINTLGIAVERANIDQIRRMSDLVEEMLARAASGETFVEQDRAFHLALFSSAGNEPLEQLLAAFWNLFSRSGVGRRHTGLVESAKQHKAMLDAFARGDLENLTRLTKEQLSDARYRIILALTGREQEIKK
jgi:GntR family transcriptional repressor for pyruvate dehydrogenase complex